MKLEIIVIGENKSVVNYWESDSNLVDCLGEGIVNTKLLGFSDEEHDDEELMDDMMEICGHIMKSKEQVCEGKYVFRDVDDRFLEIYMVSVIS